MMKNNVKENENEATLQFSVDLEKFKSPISSPVHCFKGYKWSIKAVVQKDQELNKKFLGFFLECSKQIIQDEDDKWSCPADVEMRLLSTNSSKTIVRNFTHLFYENESVWGYSYFLPVSEILHPHNNYVNFNEIVFEVKIQCLEKSINKPIIKGCLSDFSTSYKSSILLCLFFINNYRLALFQTVPEYTVESFPAARITSKLQKIFFDLQCSEKFVETREFFEQIKNFAIGAMGIEYENNSSDSTVFLRVLLYALGIGMKNFVSANNFAGVMKLITNVESKTRSEKSIVRQVHVYDIHLKVHRRKDVFEALDHYVSTKDVWDQKICYDYCIFLSFPKVLHFHILRSYLDSETNTKKICNTSFEFNEKMNLKNYLEQTRNSKNKCAPCTDFILHSVFARSADENHYVLFVNPRCDGNWYKFENDTVTRVHEDEAIKENYVRDGRTSNKGQTSAYMLTYIQVSAIDEILVEIDENDIPQNLREKFYENYMKSKFVDANL